MNTVQPYTFEGAPDSASHTTGRFESLVQSPGECFAKFDAIVGAR